MLDKLAKNIVVFFSTVILLTCTIISMFFIATVKNFDENVMIKLTTSVGLICYLAIDFIIVFGIKNLAMYLIQDIYKKKKTKNYK